MPRPPDRGVWQEVRRRRVMKVVVAYLGLAFGVLEVALYLAHGLPTSDVVARAVLGTLVLGFPLAVVLAWTYDITPSGVVKTPDQADSGEAPRVSKWGWLLVATFGIAFGIGLELLR